MKKKERKDYIKAVKCLFDLPAKTRDFADGARTRHDDFVAVHINQTLQIHQTVRRHLFELYCLELR
jgi:tyrosinase